MLRTALFKFPKRQPFHTSSLTREEWTKASLRRMKKVELTRLAKENNLNYSGTKNDIIIQLLTHQTAKIVGTSTPSMQTIKSISESVASEEEEEGGYEPDSTWMNAFDMKVAQRGTRKPLDNTSKPHHYNDQIKPSTLLQPTQDKPKPTSSASPVPIISSTTKDQTKAEEVEGMDPQWVEAFELKVGSRGARSQLTDTLSPSTSAITEPFDNIEFVSINNKNDHNEKEEVVLEEKIKEEPKAEENHTSHKQDRKEEGKARENKGHATHDHVRKPTENGSNTTSNDDSDSSRETIINTAVGSSMFLWYYGEGLSKIWHFLTSSS